jgi:hypothetical protein
VYLLRQARCTVAAPHARLRGRAGKISSALDLYRMHLFRKNPQVSKFFGRWFEVSHFQEMSVHYPSGDTEQYADVRSSAPSGPSNTDTDTCFNPRSPHGERLTNSCSGLLVKVFQCTLPVWGATVAKGRDELLVDVSIHAPRMGSDNR